MDIDDVAARVSATAAAVTSASTRLGLVGPGPAAFGGDGPGRIGELGRDLQGLWSAAMAAREREAAGHGARLTDLAGALGAAAQGYRDAEDAAHQRHRAVG